VRGRNQKQAIGEDKAQGGPKRNRRKDRPKGSRSPAGVHTGWKNGEGSRRNRVFKGVCNQWQGKGNNGKGEERANRKKTIPFKGGVVSRHGLNQKEGGKPASRKDEREKKRLGKRGIKKEGTGGGEAPDAKPKLI